MKVIVGLGNPGKKYEGTRHNVGFYVLDKLAQELGIMNYELRNKLKAKIAKRDGVVFAKPQTFMNRSGEAVSKVVNFYKVQLNEVYVVHDDLDIDLGNYKIQKGKGPKVHGGLASIYEKLGSKDFWRVRVGIENRNNESGMMNQEEKRANNWVFGEKYVLQRFNEVEQETLDRVISEVVEDLRKRLFE